MSRRQPDLTLDGLRLPVAVGGQIEQTYEDFGAITLLRLGAGAAVHQEVWRKTRTSISISGALPVGLDAIDWKTSHALGCVAPRSIQSAGNVITIPAARRSDAAPYGWAITAAGLLTPTAVTLADNVATLSPVAGAAAYQVAWYPQLTVRAPTGPTVSYDALGAVVGWELTAEEA